MLVQPLLPALLGPALSPLRPACVQLGATLFEQALGPHTWPGCACTAHARPAGPSAAPPSPACAQLGATFFEQALGPQCLKWLEDSVFSIREAATRNLMKLAQEFGPDWARVHLVPQVSFVERASGMQEFRGPEDGMSSICGAASCSERRSLGLTARACTWCPRGRTAAQV